MFNDVILLNLAEINVLDVYIVNNIEGKPSGEAYVLLDNSDDVKAALQKDQESMGRRYIEVFTIGEVETDQVLRRMERRAAVANQGTIRVRGLPFSCSSDDIRNFFKGTSYFNHLEEENVLGRVLVHPNFN